MEQDRRRLLEYHFRQQHVFASGYSPLYAHLFAIVAEWLAADNPDPVVDWLVDAAAERAPFDVTLLLMAAIHREVLAGEPAAEDLARFFPTAAVWRPSARQTSLAIADSQPPAIERATRALILAEGDRLAGFIRRANVQTNETGRGIAWLLPVARLGWPAVHLVELGASAGLNLVAERRVYRLADVADPGRTLLVLGDGRPQFTTLVRGGTMVPHLACCPVVLSRTGGDMFPFHLQTAEDELTLASFVWGDQVRRIERLREGIAALRSVESSAAPVSLRPLHLPDGLASFLTDGFPRSLQEPVVLFNTTVTMYLPDHGATLRGIVAEWAATQSAPVLWMQWEPRWDGSPSPEPDWLAWTADYWPNDGRQPHHHRQLAWVHPHGTALEWTTDLAEYLCITG